MPPLPNVPNVLRSDIQWEVGTDAQVTTKLFWRYSGSSPTNTDAIALAADIYNAMSAIHAFWTPATSLTGVKVTDLSSNVGGVGEFAQVTVGTLSGATLPASTAVLTNWQISRRYRGGKPRSYWPWFGAGDVNTRQTWMATSVTGVDSHLATFMAAVIGSVSGATTITQHVSVSYYESFTVVVNPITGRSKNVAKLRAVPLVDQIQSYATSLSIASQRRRVRAG